MAGMGLYGPAVTQESLVAPLATGGVAAPQTGRLWTPQSLLEGMNHRFRGDGPASSGCGIKVTKRVGGRCSAAWGLHEAERTPWKPEGVTPTPEQIAPVTPVESPAGISGIPCHT
jgi:hypothetical protein